MLFGKKSEHPEKTDHKLVEAARKIPNGYVYAIDAEFEGKEIVPSENIKGAFKVNAQGIIEGDFIPNANYKRK